MTLRHVVRDEVRVETPYVFVCENPVVVERGSPTHR